MIKKTNKNHITKTKEGFIPVYDSCNKIKIAELHITGTQLLVHDFICRKILNKKESEKYIKFNCLGSDINKYLKDFNSEEENDF